MDWVPTDTPADKVAVIEAWPDARSLTDARLRRLLDVAEASCRAYAPALPVDEAGVEVGPVPPSYAEAVILQARELRAAATREGGDVIVADSGVVRARPLSGVVKQLLRPRRGGYSVG